jgi:hypothetical protein
MNSEQSSSGNSASSEKAKDLSGLPEFGGKLESKQEKSSRGSWMTAGEKGSTFKAISEGVVGLVQLAQIAKEEFSVSDEEADKIVERMIRQWMNIKKDKNAKSDKFGSRKSKAGSIEIKSSKKSGRLGKKQKDISIERVENSSSSSSSSSSDSRVANFGGGDEATGDESQISTPQTRTERNVSSIRGRKQLQSPSRELQELMIERVSVGSSSGSTLSNQIFSAVHGGNPIDDSDAQRENDVQWIGPEMATPQDEDDDEYYEELVEDGFQKEESEEDYYDDDNFGEYESESRIPVKDFGLIPVERMSTGHRLTRKVVIRELMNSGISLNDLDAWDPLTCALTKEMRKRLARETEIGEAFLPVPGTPAPPLRGKGRIVWSRDMVLYKVMSDGEVVMKGLLQALASSLNGRGEEAVTRLAKVFVLVSSMLTQVNSERVRLRFPQEVANRMLRPRTEPVLRKEHRARAREAAQEVKDSDTIMKGLFRRGGRSASMGRGRKRPRGSFGTSFPRRNSRFRQNSSSQFKTNKFSQSPKNSTKRPQ